jgi:hypothetical protein
MKKLKPAVFLLSVFLITSCFNNSSKSVIGNNAVAPEQNEKPSDSKETEAIPTAEQAAFQMIKLIKEKDFEAVSHHIHPLKGVRFTPYGYINVESDLVFHTQEIPKLWSNGNVYLWGEFDGTGDPIELTFADYYDRFIYDADFVNAEEIAVNERLGQGNSLDNSKDVYPDGTFIEFHFSGFDEKYDGMDWRSLRLVLEQLDGKWYLIGIIHDQWTI